MQLIMFSKMLKNYSVGQLIEKAHELGLDGYDLAVRPEYAVNPDNAGTALKNAVKDFKKDGLSIPMVTGRGDLLIPEDEDVRSLLKAMDAADVRLLKLGYFKTYGENGFDYWKEVEKIREIFRRWAVLGRTYNVKILYHTHSSDPEGRDYFGGNASAIMHLLNGLDNKGIGAYIDAGHLAVEGERFRFASCIVRDYLQAVALKDVRTVRDNLSAPPKRQWVSAGYGIVDWKMVFSTLKEIDFKGPLSIHCEYEYDTDEDFFRQLPNEIDFFKKEQVKIA